MEPTAGSSMTATFQCPHCEASYPLLPTLYGRSVRCSTCKQAFRLRGDGIAEKVVGKKTTAINRPERSEQEKENLTKAFISKSKEEKQRKPATKRLQKKQENSKSLSDLRKSMSSALNAAASEAIAVEERKQEPPNRPSQRKVNSEKFTKAQSAPVLTGEGQRANKQLYGFAAFCIICIVLIGGCVLLIEPSTPQELALRAYTATTDQYNNPKKRLFTYLQRNVLVSYDGISKPTVIVNVDRAVTKEAIEHELTKPCLVIQTKLTGLTDYPDLAMWATAKDSDTIMETWQSHQSDATPDQFYAALTKKGITFCSYLTIYQDLMNQSKTPLVSFMLSALLVGSTDYKGNNKWADKLLAGDTPSHCIISEFHGEDGQEFQIIGNKNSFRKIPSYSGSLVKFIGNHWDDQWRILTCHPKNIEPQNPLLQKYRIFTAGMLERNQRNQTNYVPDGEFVPDNESPE